MYMYVYIDMFIVMNINIYVYTYIYSRPLDSAPGRSGDTGPCIMGLTDVAWYRGTSPIRKRPPP